MQVVYREGRPRGGVTAAGIDREKVSCNAVTNKVSANLGALWSWEGPQSWVRAGPLYSKVMGDCLSLAKGNS